MLETLWTGRSRQPAPPRPPHSTSLQRFSDKRRSHEAPTSFEGHENQMWMFSKSKKIPVDRWVSWADNPSQPRLAHRPSYSSLFTSRTRELQFRRRRPPSKKEVLCKVC